MSNKTTYSQVDIVSLVQRIDDRSLEALEIARRTEAKVDAALNQARPWWVNVSYPIAAASLLVLVVYYIVLR